MADATLRTILGTVTEVFGSGLNAHAAAATKESSTVTLTSGEEDYPEVLVWLFVDAFGGTPSASASFQGWFLKTLNGTKEFGTTTDVPARPADFQIDIKPISGIDDKQFPASGPVRLPRHAFTVLLYNGTGQALASTNNNKLYLQPITYKADEA
jgi:hypothetical protein